MFYEGALIVRTRKFTFYVPNVVGRQNEKTRGLCPANYRVKISDLNQSNQMTQSPRFFYPVVQLHIVYLPILK